MTGWANAEMITNGATASNNVAEFWQARKAVRYPCGLSTSSDFLPQAFPYLHLQQQQHKNRVQ